MADAAKKLEQAPTIATKYKSVDLHHPLMTPSKRDRQGQQISTIRAGDDVALLEHAAGVEVRGGAWCGVIPWPSIKRAVFG